MPPGIGRPAMERKSHMLLFDENTCAGIVLKNASPYVKLAAEDLRRDFERVSAAGHLPKFLPEEKGPCIILEENTRNSAEPISDEGFTLTVKGDRLTIFADSYLGTLWGIYTISEKFLGVNPCYIFNDIPTKVYDKIEVPEITLTDKPKSFGFRGAFLNDEDFLTAWKDGGGLRYMDFPWYSTTVPTEVMDKVVETVLRLKLNLIIPASFLNLDNPPEKALADCAAKRGLYLSQHHIEPLGVSSYSFDRYCRENGMEAKYSYIESPAALEKAWRYYAEKWAQYDHVVWQIGLRGVGDRPLWQEEDPTEDELRAYGKVISSAYEKQKEIILECTKGKAKHFTCTLWMEGSTLSQKGYLTFPKDTTIVFADAGPSQTYGKEYYTDRLPGFRYGIYYHVAFFDCGPHFCPETGLDKLLYHVGIASQNGDNAYFIMNVSNIREFTYEICAYSQMVWNTETFSKEDYQSGYAKNFGKFADELQAEISEYFDCFPTVDKHLIPYFQGKYYNYAIEEVPDTIKLFILKEGTVLRHGQELYQSFFRPGDSGWEYGKVYEALKKEFQLIERLREKIRDTASKMDEGPRHTVEVTWLLYVETLICIYSWFINLYEAREALHAKEAKTMKERILTAAKALERQLEIRKRAEYGDFENWYRGDRKMDLHKHLYHTYRLIGYCPKTVLQSTGDET